ncbi:hypothetical protein DWW36_01310 [Erysipelotrichaceae bacterium AF15-26LB]|nr:hypothetical protein DWX45_04775 [Erysipelotrichaceae bacterium AF19-24AC]RJV93081.1 hypothetical protein DWW36_01310 [Erysipelotrichaceae bacterium AF15-26LB]
MLNCLKYLYVHGICKKAFLYIKLCKRAMIMQKLFFWQMFPRKQYRKLEACSFITTKEMHA